MKFQIDVNSPASPLEKYWELCVGSCHATTALREDYRNQLKKCQRELGFRYVRFHGIFDDDMSVLSTDWYTGNLKLSFTNIDNIFDFLLSIRMKPFIELGFMPECLKSKNTTVFHYRGNTSPPSDYKKWSWFIRSFILHLLERYGRGEVRQWFFEVWNEPNLGGADSQSGFWSGSMKEYFKLYAVTARTIKSVDPSLRVGGPATSNNAWIPEMVHFCKEEAVPIDFISTHHYPTDVVLGYGVEDSVNFVQPPKDRSDKKAMKKYQDDCSTFQIRLWEKVERGVLTKMDRKAVSEACGLPVYYTEWNSLAGLPSDGPFGSSFIVKTVLDSVNLVKGYSYWTFSDIFEENGMPGTAFHGGFGLLNLQGIPKASYRAFELLHSLGNSLYAKKLSEGTVDIYTVRKSESNALQFMAVNHNSLFHPIKSESVSVEVTGLPDKASSTLPADIERIDKTHANALECWKNMGSPESLSAQQIEKLQASSELTRESFHADACGGTASFSFEIPPMGIALITLYL